MGLETGTYISDLVTTNPTATDLKNQGDDHIRLLKSTVKATFPNISGAVTPTHTELNYVDGVTSSIQTQLDAKGAHAGQTWTGTHNFTGATVTVATASSGDADTSPASTAFVDTYFAKKASPAFTGTPTAPTASPGTNSTQVATTAYVDAAAFSSALPSQTGNSGKVVTTDGTNASWVTPQSAIPQVIAEMRYTTGTNGGSHGSGWQDRVLNTLARNAGSLVSLSGNAVVLPAGTYIIRGWAGFLLENNTPASTNVGIRIYNATAGTTVARGPNSRLFNGWTSGDGPGGVSLSVTGAITLASAANIKLQTFASGAEFGRALSSGDYEVYAQLEITAVI